MLLSVDIQRLLMMILKKYLQGKVAIIKKIMVKCLVVFIKLKYLKIIESLSKYFR